LQTTNCRTYGQLRNTLFAGLFGHLCHFPAKLRCVDMRVVSRTWFLFCCLLNTITLLGQVWTAGTRPLVFDSLLRTTSDTLYFASGSWELAAEADTVLALFVAHPNAQLYLTGHTDNVGSIAANETLARRRAQTAADFLMRSGWTREQILVQTFGERQPRNPNRTASQRQNNRRVTIDQFVPKPYRPLLVEVREDSSKNPIPQALIRLHNRSLADTLAVDAQGQLRLDLPLDSIVGLDAYAEGFFYHSRFLKVRPQFPAVLTIYLKAAKPGATADIANLYFVPSKAILLPQSRGEPEKVLRFLQVNPKLSIEIAGHVNYPNRPPVQTNTFEWELSVRRARFLHDWLIAKGIAPERLSYQGYGNHEMRFPRAQTEDEQQQNRRVEIRVVPLQ
jgi:outer membrane protein OmpA-like peptidoglycan-associated protein